jgi:hypothetical protein
MNSTQGGQDARAPKKHRRPYFKLRAMSQFILFPWEHAFSGASSRPHAQARLSIGGKTRNFLLKMQGGVIFFKEPSRGQVFAIPEPFEQELSRDSVGLVSRWQSAVTAGNFGAFVLKRDYFPKLPVRAQILIILKPDGSGWMKEHFDDEWFLLPEDKAVPLDVWNDKDVEFHIRERLPFVQRSLINRALDPQILELDPPTWKAEDGEKITELLVAATRGFIEPSNPWNGDERRILKIKSHSAFSKGDIEGFWLKHALHNPKFARVWELLEPRIQFVGVRWSEGGEQLDQYGRTRNAKVFKEGLEKWGQLWRGNWAPQRASFRVQLPDVSNQSAHERLEAGLVLRDWLRGKMSEGEIEALLGSA